MAKIARLLSRDPEIENEALRARVAKLEAALQDCVTWNAEARQLLNRIALSETVEA